MATTMMATEQLLLIKATEKNIERKRIILLRKLFAARMTKIIERKRLIKQTKYFVMEIVNFLLSLIRSNCTIFAAACLHILY